MPAGCSRRAAPAASSAAPAASSGSRPAPPPGLAARGLLGLQSSSAVCASAAIRSRTWPRLRHGQRGYLVGARGRVEHHRREPEALLQQVALCVDVLHPQHRHERARDRDRAPADVDLVLAHLPAPPAPAQLGHDADRRPPRPAPRPPSRPAPTSRPRHAVRPPRRSRRRRSCIEPFYAPQHRVRRARACAKAPGVTVGTITSRSRSKVAVPLARSERQRPGLADEVVAEGVVGLRTRRGEARALVEAAGVREDVVGPQSHADVPGGAGEA